jgi:hypothetical protein
MNPIRRDGLIVQDVSGENLVYDADSTAAVALNLPATRVFALCDGTRSVDQIVAYLGAEEPAMSADAVKLALVDLVEADLIDAPPVEPSSTRRQLLVKLGVAAAITLPAVELITAPTAAAAGSNGVPQPAPAPVPAPLPQPVAPPLPQPVAPPLPQPVAPPLPQPVAPPLPQPVPDPAPVAPPFPVPAPLPDPQ